MTRVELTDYAPQKDTILHIRFEVFVEEQGVDPALEIDGIDPDCVHALAYEENLPVGTGRLLPDGHIGRMAVLKTHRGLGVGSALLSTLIDAARERKVKSVALSSQVQAIPFYERFGFRASGPVYLEAGIEHRDMTLALAPEQ